ncbi:MAG: arabinose ABC transporter permease, partial [Oxalobacteraceae bacterium]
MLKRSTLLLPAVFVLCATEFLQAGVVAFGASPMMGEIGAGPEEFSVIASLYACVAVVSIAKQQWLIERIGWRMYLLGTTFVYILGAQLCAYGDRLAPFAMGRVLMAAGGGGL